MVAPFLPSKREVLRRAPCARHLPLKASAPPPCSGPKNETASPFIKGEALRISHPKKGEKRGVGRGKALHWKIVNVKRPVVVHKIGGIGITSAPFGEKGGGFATPLRRPWKRIKLENLPIFFGREEKKVWENVVLIQLVLRQNPFIREDCF